MKGQGYASPINHKFLRKFNARAQRAIIRKGTEESIGRINKREKNAKKNLFLSVALCAFASLRLCVKIARVSWHTLKYEMGLMGNRMGVRFTNFSTAQKPFPNDRGCSYRAASAIGD
jgi:hypothetical protein